MVNEQAKIISFNLGNTCRVSTSSESDKSHKAVFPKWGQFCPPRQCLSGDILAITIEGGGATGS